MTTLDNLILEMLDELGEPAGDRLAVNPKQMYVNLIVIRGLTDKSSTTVSRRMRNLTKMGFLDRVDTEGAYYTLTEKGERYLAGDLTIDDIPRPDE